jgi:anti-anti-sigma regulatory factor/HAMP domain-containing protein
MFMNASSIAPAESHMSIPRRHQLRWHLVLYFVALATVPLLSAVSFALIQMRAQSERQVITQLESVAELKQGQIDEWIESGALVIDGFLLDTDTYTDMLDLDTASQINIPLQTRVNADLRALAALHLEGHASPFRKFFLYDRRGNIQASSVESDIGKVVVNQPYFASSLTASYVQPPYYAVGDASLTMLITRPLHNQQGQTVGVLAGALNLTELGQIMLERTGLGESGETYLVSSESNYLVTPSRSPEYPLNHAYHSLGIDRALQGERGAGVYTDYRTPPVQVIGAYRWIPALNTALLAEIDETEAQGLFARTATLSGTLAGIAAVLAVMLGLFVATRVARPITALAQTATRITDGALDQRVVVARRDEIGLLATAFNRMTARLQQTLEGLEQRVAERTAELERANADAQGALAELRESVRERELLSATVRELASPVMPVLEGILVMPLIGAIDSKRATLLMDSLLGAIERHRARIVIMDVTGVPLVDTQVAQTLMHAADAARLLGAKTILVGVRPELAQTIVGLGLDLRGLVTCADLQSGVGYALRQGS